MPFSPCCKRKYSKSCKCSSPCNNCECIDQRGQCPPPPPPSTTEESDTATLQLYTPVIAAAPANKKCCCCDVKPKKSLWQQLFGDRKCCCAPSQKKKQDCLCKPRKKSRCVPECTNSLCCSDLRRQSPATTTKPCKPLCCCKKVKASKCCKPCCPSPESIFGCHFFCNVENRENRSKQSRRRCCCCCCFPKCDQSSTVTPPETTDATTEDEKIIKSYEYTNNCKAPPVRYQEPLVTKRTQPLSKELLSKKQSEISRVKSPVTQAKPQHIEKPTHSNFHIGLTFTNTETKYYKNNSVCTPPEEETKYSNDENEGSSSEQIITLEIHQSDDNVDEGKEETHENIRGRDEETASISSSKRRKLSTLQEENEKYRNKTESYSQEILSDERINKKNKNESGSGTLTRSREKRMANYETLNGHDLDKRVSEILRRLRTIENKINNIDTKKTENKTYKLETDGNRSTISFHFKDGQQYNNNFENNHRYKTKNNGSNYRKPDAVIEIRKTRSKSYSPVRKDSLTQISKYRYSRSLDRGSRGSRGQREKPKLVIKFPHGNKVSEGFVSMYSNKKAKHLDYRDSEWMEVSNELKNRRHMSTPCYCYECVCRRLKCR